MTDQQTPPFGHTLSPAQTKLVLSALEDYRHNLESLLKMPDLPKKTEAWYREEFKTLQETQQLFQQN